MDSPLRRRNAEGHLNLEDLPNEIIHSICCRLCSHCRLLDFTDSGTGRAALGSLARASRRLCSVAQPVLFHVPDFAQHTHPWFDERCWPLVHTLLTRPDVASWARELDVAALKVGVPRARDLPDRLEVLAKAGRALKLDPPGDQGFSKAARDKPTFDRLVVQLLVAALPNLEVLTFPIHYDWPELASVDGDGQIEFLHHRFRRLEGFPGLPKLRELSFDGMCHVGDPSLRTLLNEAPAVDKLVFDQLWGLLEPSEDSAMTTRDSYRNVLLPISNVRTLAIQSGHEGLLGQTSCNYLEAIIRGAPTLEHFHFGLDVVAGPVSADRIIAALEPCKARLRYLSLWGNVNGDSFAIGAGGRRRLDEFTALEVLKLDEPAFCRRLIDEEEGGGEGEGGDVGGGCKGTCLSAVVPASVKVLALGLYMTKYARTTERDTIEDVLDLAIKAKDGEFLPNLRHFQIDLVGRYVKSTEEAREIRHGEEIEAHFGEDERGFGRVAEAFLDAGVRVWARLSERYVLDVESLMGLART